LKLTLFRTSITLFDVTFSEQNNYITSVQTAFSRANFIPFHSIHYYLISRQEPLEVGLINIFGNIIMFIPFGFFLPLIWSEFRNIQGSTAIILCTSISFELIQLLMAVGNFDMDDILLNTLGGMIGYTLFKIGMRFSA
jgi:glycopeptide antibiotics resistance protein